MATALAPAPEVVASVDQVVRLYDVRWDDFERILAIRGERAGLRVTYLEGVLELMSPSRGHEGKKTIIGRLLEAYAEVAGLKLDGFGSWTLKNRSKERAVEPDECYVLDDPDQRKRMPDLAIEVDWSHSGMNKLEVYRGLGVGELWTWRDGRIEVHVLERGRYHRREESRLLPALDLERLARFLDEPDQTGAVRRYRAELERRRRAAARRRKRST